jgi:hypothetical protein
VVQQVGDVVSKIESAATDSFKDNFNRCAEIFMLDSNHPEPWLFGSPDVLRDPHQAVTNPCLSTLPLPALPLSVSQKWSRYVGDISKGILIIIVAGLVGGVVISLVSLAHDSVVEKESIVQLM